VHTLVTESGAEGIAPATGPPRTCSTSRWGNSVQTLGWEPGPAVLTPTAEISHINPNQPTNSTYRMVISRC
jgi:hypothetical protein